MAERYPVAVSGQWEILGLRVRGPELIVIIVVPVLTVALTYYLRRTAQGRAIRAAASNPDLARLTAISPKIISTITWIIAGLLAAVALILVAGINGQPSGFPVTGTGHPGPGTGRGPDREAPKLSGGDDCRSGPRVAPIAAGLKLAHHRGALRWLALRDRHRHHSCWPAGGSPAATSRSRLFPPPARFPTRWPSLWWVRHSSRIGIGLLVAAAAILPFLITLASRQLLFSEVLLFALLGISLVVLSGWTGQISLGQAALAGIGGLITAALVAGRDIGIGLGGTSFTLALPDIHFLLALLVGAAATGAVAVAIGLGALRIRGFHLAIATLALALLGQQFLWRRPFLSGGSYTRFAPPSHRARRPGRTAQLLLLLAGRPSGGDRSGGQDASHRGWAPMAGGARQQHCRLGLHDLAFPGGDPGVRGIRGDCRTRRRSAGPDCTCRSG